jgi:hypothetical protein
MLNLEAVHAIGSSLACIAGPHGVSVAIAGDIHVDDKFIVILSKDGQTRQLEAQASMNPDTDFLPQFYALVGELAGKHVSAPTVQLFGASAPSQALN